MTEDELTPVTFEPEERTTLAPGTRTVPDVDGRLSVGRMQVTDLVEDQVDEASRPFLRSRPTSRFHLVRLNVSFERDDENPLVDAWIDVRLTAEPPGDDQPLAWSMSPRTESDALATTQTVTLSPELSLEVPGTKLSAKAGSAATAQTYTREVPRLQALRQGTSEPRWLWSSTPVTEISGPYELTLVVERPRDVGVAATAEVGATIRLRRLKVFRFRARLGGSPLQSLRIAPA